MKKVKRMLAAVAMVCIVSAGAFAQKKDEPKRPPKDPDNKVVVKEKPAPNPNPNPNSNKGGKKP